MHPCLNLSSLSLFPFPPLHIINLSLLKSWFCELCSTFHCIPPLFDGLYISLSWWHLPAVLGAFGFCLSYPGWVCP